MIIRHNNFIKEFFTFLNFVVILVAFKGGFLIGIGIMVLYIILSINFSASIAVENEALQVYYNYLSSWNRNRVIKKEDIKSIKIKFYSKFIYSPYTYIVIETKNMSTPITIYLGVDLEYYDALFLKKELEKFIATEVQLV